MTLVNLIFDFDGVIADSQDYYDKTIVIALKKAGNEYSRKEVLENTNLQFIVSNSPQKILDNSISYHQLPFEEAFQKAKKAKPSVVIDAIVDESKMVWE